MDQELSLSLAVAVGIAVFVFLGLYLWEKKRALSSSDESRKSEGAFRSYFHILWALFLWASFVFLLPLLVTYKDRLSSVTQFSERAMMVAKAAYVPLLLLLLLTYGYRRNYFRWIKNFNWPGRSR